ncbi:RNB domain-containing ribonuclease [Microlunatus speluncae]|uniref:RNB domain-containing ribonuclease n=1 Tax=Microlunatus speluncae TaxID=2594267 RepID=UPI0012665E8D|nr:RNB domain-containing ribonuclease [Microlunatus speluncae]
MPARKVALSEQVQVEVADGLTALRAELQVPDEFPADVVAAAEAAARAIPLPELDRTDLELITIDPEGSRDLDQALHLAPDGDGFVVSYAIADVGAFVEPGGPIDLEAQRRGQTLYAPDRRTPLHPPALSEGAASLLPDQVRPAVLWTIRLDAAGKQADVTVQRARVRSREQLTYVQAQAEIDGGSARPSLELLRTVGRLREQQERDRGGVSLPIPEQVTAVDDHQWSLEFRSPLPVEGWNAQISLLTGMAAARIMLDGKIGILRTLPPAEDASLHRLRRIAKALRIPWPDDLGYPDFVRTLDPAQGPHAAMLAACTSLFRGAGYASFAGAAPEQPVHAALATEYAHTTAPLRRLVDRYVGEICLALTAGEPVPDWITTALPELPATMQASEQKAKRYEREVVNLVELALLRTKDGMIFDAMITEVDRKKGRGEVVIADPAVEAAVLGDGLRLGEELKVRLVQAELDRGTVAFEPA